MIEQALYEHLIYQDSLAPHLARYDEKLAVFNQEAPADVDDLWECGRQYGRIVFAVDLQGDPERTMGGTLAVDIMCKEDEQVPEEIEPILRDLIHGYFFSSDIFTVAAQWRDSSYFTQPTDHVTGCTLSFDLLAFPVITTRAPDVVSRLNRWTATIRPGIHVINHMPLPDAAWRPKCRNVAVYWRLVRDDKANWIPDTFQTIWRTATIKGHIFAEHKAEATSVALELTRRLHAAKRLLKPEETPIMVNQRNYVDDGADPLKTGQVTVEATYGVIVHFEETGTIEHINY